MKLDASSSRTGAAIAAAIGALTAFALLLLYWKYVFSSFLFADDNYFLPQAVLGGLEVTFDSPRRILFASLGWTGSFAALKSSALLSTVLAACLAVAVLRKAGLSLIFATLFVCAIFTFPLAVSQQFFVMGAHPTMGAVWVLAAIYVFLTAVDLEGRDFLIRMGVVSALLIVAAMVSVIYSLALLAPIFGITALILLRRRISAHSIGAIGLMIIPAVILIGGRIGGHNYETLQGWTNYSVATVIGNFWNALNMVVAQISDRPANIRWTYILCFAALIACMLSLAFRSRHAVRHLRPAAIAASHPTLILVVGMCLVVSMLAFGPASITKTLLDRYVLAPFVFGALAVGAILGRAFTVAPKFFQYACVGLLSLATVNNLLARNLDLNEDFARLLDSHHHIQRLVDAENKSWPENAQILILLGPPLITTTRAFNHWSSWYLKGLARRRDIIGVIGRPGQIEGDPFIDRYCDHASIFWEVRDGMSRRKRMIGLVRDRPLFAYKLSGSDSHTDNCLQCTVIFSSGNAKYATLPGQAPNASMPLDSRGINQIASRIVWPGRVDLFRSNDPDRGIDAGSAPGSEPPGFSEESNEPAECSDLSASNP